MLRQEASRPKAGVSEADGEPQQAATTSKNQSLTATSGLAQSQLLAIEKAAASTRTYALENLGDYRGTRMVGRGMGDLRGGGRPTIDATGMNFGGKSLQDASALPEVGRSRAQIQCSFSPNNFRSREVVAIFVR